MKGDARSLDYSSFRVEDNFLEVRFQARSGESEGPLIEMPCRTFCVWANVEGSVGFIEGLRGMHFNV